VSDWFFFDCFNTLIDDFDASGDESGLCSLPELALELGVVTARAEFIEAYGAARRHAADPHLELDLKRRLESVVAQGPLSPERAALAVQHLLERWHEEYEGSLRLTPGAAEMLAHWAGQRRLAVISNFHVAGYPRRYLERFGIAHHFEFILDSAAFGYRKPGPRIFEEALHRANCPPQRVVFIGDRLDLDIEPAHSLGMSTLHFNRGATRPNVAETPAHFRFIRHWHEFR
jgi:HAD superfamily hydrolase (TIGR01509 family)